MARKRKFDHEEAGRLHASGLTYARIARRLGVSSASVRKAVAPLSDEQKERRDARLRDRYQAPCKGGCGRIVWAMTHTSGYCRFCSNLARSQTIRPDTLLCAHCKEWKPDEEFPLRRGAITRRDRGYFCRPCETATRRARRRRATVPCVNCGRPRDPRGKTGLCRKCSLERAEPLLLGPPE